jgi:hypothetical protein
MHWISEKNYYCAFVKENAPAENNPLKLQLRFAQGRPRPCFLLRILFYTRYAIFFQECHD